MKKIFKQKLLTIIIPIIAVLAITLSSYLYLQLKQNPQVQNKNEITEIIDKISKLMVLPIGENPTLATVSDPEVLKDQAFFNQAQKGDKVLIYTQAKKAILYSVTLDRIIDIAPFDIETQKTSNSPVVKTTIEGKKQ